MVDTKMCQWKGERAKMCVETFIHDSCQHNNNNNNNNNKIYDLMTTATSTSLLAFDWDPTYVSLISVLAERPLRQEDCRVCRAEGATVALRDITT